MPDPAFTPGAHRLAEPRWFDDLQLGERFLNPSRTMTEALFAACRERPYDMNGKVTPVAGITARLTPI